jgi:hypothetical protein
MLRFLNWFFGLFSSYVRPLERKVDKLFRSIKSTDNIANIQDKLLEYMQENLVVTNLWMEKKYKGYRYLSKRTRKKMYRSVDAIKVKFDQHCSQIKITNQELRENILAKGLLFPRGDEKKLAYVAKIMSFLKPGLYYKYEKTANFGKLLKNPDKEKMVGDCNQIVTFYAYLYSLKFPIKDLKIKLLKDHVCLHFRDIDIEATNGTFAKYDKFKHVLPITEILSTNLLDLTDFREEVQKISARAMVKSAQLAYAISSLKELVVKNLDIAYHNLAVSAMNGHDFDTAIFYIKKTDRKDVLDNIYRNATAYYLDQHSFKKAKYYASRTGDSRLKEMVVHNEAILNYNKLLKKVADVRTLTDAKKHKSTYKKMLRWAQKMDDDKRAEEIRKTLGKM